MNQKLSKILKINSAVFLLISTISVNSFAMEKTEENNLAESSEVLVTGKSRLIINNQEIEGNNLKILFMQNNKLTDPQFRADEIKFSKDKNIVELLGNAIFKLKTMSIKGDYIKIKNTGKGNLE